MLNGRFDWLLSLQARLILASAAIVVLAIFLTSGVFVYRDRQEQRVETLKQIASATQGFSISTFAPGNIVGGQGVPFEIAGRQMEPGVIGQQAPLGGARIEGEVKTISGGDTLKVTREFTSVPDYRFLLVNSDGQVVNDPAGTLGGVQLSYPSGGLVETKKGYVTWAGDAANATGGLTFLAPTDATMVSAGGLKAVAAIDSTSLTADWLATAPDLALSALVGLPLAMAAVVLATRRITHPLRDLIHAVEAMSHGDFDQRVEVRGRDEVATLASSFTVMAGRVKERDTQLRNLIANVSHDLRTPLTSIQGYAEALADGVAKPADVDRAAQIIRDEARHASSLLANLLGLSEIESGEVVVRRVEYDVAELVQRCLSRIELRAKDRGIEIRLAGTTAPSLIGDPDKIERALCNLVENAVKFARTRIHVRLAASATEASISISNDGPPIAPEDAERIFDRFYRAGGPNAGTGLGLAIARELVQLNGGRVELRSAAAPVEFLVGLPRP